MKPERNKVDYERVKPDEWIEGTIDEIEYDPQHKRSYQGQDKTGPCVRFKFNLNGYAFPHRSSWMSFTYAEKSNLFKKYVTALVEDAKSDMDLDLDILKGMKIKTMWTADGDYDRLEMIRPVDKKVSAQEAEV